MFCCCFVDFAAMVCDLDKSARKCVLQSPVVNNTQACMRINYFISSDDVKLKLDVFSGDVLVDSHILLRGIRLVYFEINDLGSPISIKLTASRYLVSTDEYEYTKVYSVIFTKCPANPGRLCVNSSIIYCLVYFT